MKKPEKIKAVRDCQGYSECYANGRNETIDEYEKFLPSEGELAKIIKEYDGAYGIDIGGLAKAIAKRIGTDGKPTT